MHSLLFRVIVRGPADHARLDRALCNIFIFVFDFGLRLHCVDSVVVCCRLTGSGSSLPELQLLAARRAAGAVGGAGGGAGAAAVDHFHPAYRLNPYMEHLYSPAASLHGEL